MRIVLITLACCVAFPVTTASAVVITNTPADLWQLFPHDTQGQNGIYLQYRTVGTNEYTDLTNDAPYHWITSDAPYQIPTIAREDTPGRIWAHPSAYVQLGNDRDATMRVRLNGAAGDVRITGGVATENSPSIIFYIYKGADNWSTPLWQGMPGDTFDLTVSFAPGDELFFADNADGNDINDWAVWTNVKLARVLVPEPKTAGLLVGFLSALLRTHFP